MSANKLGSPISDSATSLLLDRLSDFPPTGIVKIDDEYILYGFAGDTNLLSLTRGFAGSDAAAHLIGAAIDLATIADLNSKNTTVKSYLTATDEVIELVLPTPDAPDAVQVVVICHQEGSDGDFSVNGVTLAAGESKVYAWDTVSWTTEPSGSGPGSGATTELDNLTTTAINADLNLEEDLKVVFNADGDADAFIFYDSADDTLKINHGGNTMFEIDANNSKTILAGSLEFTDDTFHIGTSGTALQEIYVGDLFVKTSVAQASDTDMSIIGFTNKDIRLVPQGTGAVQVMLEHRLYLSGDPAGVDGPGDTYLVAGASGQLNIHPATGTALTLDCDDEVAILYGTLTLNGLLVTIGDDDSGGTGFRALVVPNA